MAEQSTKAFVQTNDAKLVQNTDSFRNFVARVGQGTGNQNDGSHYSFNPITRNRQQMDWVYRGSWIAGRVVDSVANDMTREGVDLTTDEDPKKQAMFEKDIARIGVWDQLCQTVKWARLYGGAIGFIMIEGQNPSTPLRLETIKKDQFKGILPMDRWVAQPSLTDLVTEYGPDYGKPKFYDTMPDTGGMPRLRIHYTRVIRIEGIRLPYWQAISENLWGQSVIERLWDRLIAFDSATLGASQLVYKAHLRALSVDGLREILGGNATALSALVQNVNMIRTMQTNEGLTLLDARDKFETHQYTFSGLDEILMQFGEQLACATEIPLVRLFGQSPKGFSTGDTDLQMYYDTIRQQQITVLGHGVEKLYRIAYVSKFGTEPPETFSIEFARLWRMTEAEKGDATQKVAGSINQAFESQIISRATALKELKNLGKETGTFNLIDDEEVEEAENDPPPSPEALGLVIPPPPPVAGPGGSGKPGGAPKPGAKPAGKPSGPAKTKDSLYQKVLKFLGSSDVQDN